jgi:CubicO group peptidase (beta-lactamase class C family)
VEIEGRCEPEFERMREAFEQNFVAAGDVGAAVAVMLDGELVLDLWGGHTDAARTRRWARDTIVTCASTTKGMAGLCANLLVDRGLLDVDRPVADYWPEFAANGKDTMPVRFLLDHRAGLPVLEPPLPPDALLDWDLVVKTLAAQKPLWEPGSQHGYHAITFGYLVGEIVRRITGQSLGTFLREAVTGPLGATFFIGTPPGADELCAEPAPSEELAVLLTMMPQDPVALRRAEIPSGNGHGNARSLAAIYGTLAIETDDSPRLLRPQTLRDATSYEITGPWFGRIDGGFAATRFCCGFVLNSAVSYMGPNPNAFGYSGFGGSIAFADPHNGLGFAYTPNAQLTLAAEQDSRSGRLVDALYDAL